MTAPTDRQAAEEWGAQFIANHVPRPNGEPTDSDCGMALILADAHLAGQAHGRAAGVLDYLESEAKRLCLTCRHYSIQVVKSVEGEFWHEGPVHCDAQWGQHELARLRKEAK